MAPGGRLETLREAEVEVQRALTAIMADGVSAREAARSGAYLKAYSAERRMVAALRGLSEFLAAHEEASQQEMREAAAQMSVAALKMRVAQLDASIALQDGISDDYGDD